MWNNDERIYVLLSTFLIDEKEADEQLDRKDAIDLEVRHKRG